MMGENMFWRRWQNAYFTVEAALVVPMVLAVILFLIYMMFYQYDRCLMEQDMGMLLVKGSAYDGKNGEDRVQYTVRSMEEKGNDAYLMWNSGVMDVRQERGTLKLIWAGQLFFPFADWQIDGTDGIWAAEAEYKSSLLSPAFLIRSCRKVKKQWNHRNEITEEEH